MSRKTYSSDERKELRTLLLFLGIGVLLIGLLSLPLFPWIRQLADPAKQQALRHWADSLGIRGWLAVLGIQMLQIVLAFLPGEPVELIAGMLYGTIGGLLTCLLGCLLASSLVFCTVRRFGRPLVQRLFHRDKLSEFHFLSSSKRIELLTFLLFLIPGTPKDMLTYLAALSRIKPLDFLMIATFARIPSIITSTMMGATLRRGDWMQSLLLFLLTATLGLAGILLKKPLLARLHRQSPQKSRRWGEKDKQS